jgi:hypothetical protein
MGGQWRTLHAVALLGALTVTLGLSACSAPSGSGLPCDLPDGANLVALPDGRYEVVEADGDSYGIAFANGACLFARPAVPQTRVERSDDELRFLYDYYVVSLGPCLDTEGVPFLRPPSRDWFVSSGGNWSPYDVLFMGYLDADEIATITTLCPPLPGPMTPSW